MPTVQDIIDALNLQPHPIEGGLFRETYRSTGMMPVESLPSGYSSQSGRSFGTSIYYLLSGDMFSEMHRLPTEEVFHLYLGGPVRMLQLFAGGATREVLIGSDILAGQHPQVVVPAGVWQGSRLRAGRGLRPPGCNDGTRLRLCRLRAWPPLRAGRFVSRSGGADRAVDAGRRVIGG